MICSYYYFTDNFNYQPYVCDKRHDFSLNVMALSDFLFQILKTMIIGCILLILIKKRL